MNTLKFIENKQEVREINNIKHIKAQGKVINDDNIETDQEVNLLIKDQNTEMATWSLFENGKYRLGHVLETAQNFEHSNNDYIVLAAVNADYFYMRSADDVPVNASVIFNNKVLNAKNHFKYQALKINNKSNNLEIIKQTNSSKNPFLYVYDEDKLIYKQEISINELNKPLSIVLNNESSEGYNIEVSHELIYDDLFYLEGQITNNKSKYSIINNTDFQLKESHNIKIQYEVYDLEDSDMLVGFDGVILDQGRVLTYDEMTGQNFEHNSVRHPRTAIGINNSNEIVLAAVDGRQEQSKGVDNREFAEILRSYGLTKAFNLDGGGSTQVVYRINNKLEVINQPSEYPLRPVTNVILFIKKIK